MVYAVIGAIFGEYVGATDGLGIWMKLSQNSFRTDLVFGAILLTAIVSVALYLGVGVVERRGRALVADGTRRAADADAERLHWRPASLQDVDLAARRRPSRTLDRRR